MSPEARALAEWHGGLWKEHPQFPLGDWQYEVECDYTRLSYWDWALGKQQEDAK